MERLKKAGLKIRLPSLTLIPVPLFRAVRFTSENKSLIFVYASVDIRHPFLCPSLRLQTQRIL